MSDHPLKKTNDSFQSLRIKMGRTPSSKDFMSFVRRINNKTAIQITKDFLNQLQDFKKNGVIEDLTDNIKNIKTFLSAFMIIDNKEDIFSVHGDKENILYNCAKDMIISFESLSSLIHQKDIVDNTSKINKDLDNFHYYYKLYVAAFNNWKSGDLNRLLTVLRQSYYELQLTKEVVLKKSVEEGRELREDELIWREEIDKQCNSIEDKIMKLGGEEAIVELHKTPSTHLNINKIVKEVIESDKGKDAMARDYWKQFSDQLTAKNFSKLYDLLEEIVIRLCAIVPNREDIHKEIYDNIDVKFIKQQIDHDVFQPSQFKGLVSYIINKVKQFGPPIEDEKLDKWKTDYFDKINEDTTYAEVLPPFFNEILRRLDKIEESIEEFKKQTST